MVSIVVGRACCSHQEPLSKHRAMVTIVVGSACCSPLEPLSKHRAMSFALRAQPEIMAGANAVSVQYFFVAMFMVICLIGGGVWPIFSEAPGINSNSSDSVFLGDIYIV